MRKLLAVVLLTVSASAMAQHHHHGYWRPANGGWNWVAPVIVGGVIGYEIARPPVIVQQPPVVVQPAPPVVMQGQNCSPWTQIQNPDGSMTYTRTCQ